MVLAGWPAGPGDVEVGALRGRGGESGNTQAAARPGGIGVSHIFLLVRESIAIVVAAAIQGGQVACPLALPVIGQAIAVGVGARCNEIRLNKSRLAGEADPADIRAVNISTQAAGLQIDPGSRERLAPGIAIGEVDPTDVRPPGQPGEVSGAVMVDSEILARIVFITDAIDRLAVAQVNPAHVGPVNISGTNIFPNHRAARLVTRPIDPT